MTLLFKYILKQNEFYFNNIFQTGLTFGITVFKTNVFKTTVWCRDTSSQDRLSIRKKNNKQICWSKQETSFSLNKLCYNYVCSNNCTDLSITSDSWLTFYFCIFHAICVWVAMTTRFTNTHAFSTEGVFTTLPSARNWVNWK